MNLEIDDRDIKSIEDDFLRIADEILNHRIIKASSQRYRILKIEFYFYNHHNHKDENSHACKYERARERQLLCGAWYLHKISINPKYNYKGLDYTFGDSKNYGGILIKEVVNIISKKIFSQSKFIDELIGVLRPSSKEQFLKMIENENKIRLIKEEMQNYEIERLPRKGLSKETFKESKYAFSISKMIKK